jgi:hypothetical protein
MINAIFHVTGQKKDMDKDRMSASDLLSEEFDNIPFEGDTDTMALLNELITATGPMLKPQQGQYPL